MQWKEPNEWGQWGNAIRRVSHVQCSQCMNRTIAWHIYRFMLNKQHMKSTLVAAAAVTAVLLLFSAQLLFVCPEQSEPKLSQHWLGFYLCAFLQPSQRTQPAKFPSCPAAWPMPKRQQAYPQCTQQSTTTVRATLVDCQQKESVQIIKMLSHISVLRFDSMLSQTATGLATLPVDVINYKQNVPAPDLFICATLFTFTVDRIRTRHHSPNPCQVWMPREQILIQQYWQTDGIRLWLTKHTHICVYVCVEILYTHVLEQQQKPELT